jgi:hypothetical protein
MLSICFLLLTSKWVCLAEALRGIWRLPIVTLLMLSINLQPITNLKMQFLLPSSYHKTKDCVIFMLLRNLDFNLILKFLTLYHSCNVLKRPAFDHTNDVLSGYTNCSLAYFNPYKLFGALTNIHLKKKLTNSRGFGW